MGQWVLISENSYKREERQSITSPQGIIGHYAHYREMAQIIEQNSEIHVEETSAPPLSTAAGYDVSAPEVSGASPLPSLASEDETLAHLASLADRARGYVAAASSANTRKAYAADWKHFSAWCRRSNLTPLPPHPQTVGLLYYRLHFRHG